MATRGYLSGDTNISHGTRARIPVRVACPADNHTGLLERVGTGLLGTIGYVVLPTGVSTDVSRDIV